MDWNLPRLGLGPQRPLEHLAVDPVGLVHVRKLLSLQLHASLLDGLAARDLRVSLCIGVLPWCVRSEQGGVHASTAVLDL